MKKNKLHILLPILIALITTTMFSCKTDSAGSTGGNTTLSIQGTVNGALANQAALTPSILASVGSDISFPVEYPTGTVVGSMTLTTAKIVVKEFELEQEGVTPDGTSFEFSGPYLVDLIEHSITPPLSSIDLPEGTYNQLQFNIDKIEGDETDDTGNQLVANADPLFGHSILIEGSYTPTAGSPIAFTYTFDTDAEFQLSTATTGIEISDATVTDIIVAFRVGNWFKGIDPAAFAANPAAFAEAIKENIKTSAAYGDDSDGDGILENDETDNPGDDNLD